MLLMKQGLKRKDYILVLLDTMSIIKKGRNYMKISTREYILLTNYRKLSDADKCRIDIIIETFAVTTSRSRSTVRQYIITVR